MATQVNPPRGMRDFLPADKRRRERVLRRIRTAFEAHGFEEIETPVVEDASRLHAGLGGDNEKLAFGILRRGLTVEDLRAAESPAGLADLGLRFDLTVPLARYVATNRAVLPPVFRSIQIAPVWRAERPQKGRFRQFMQCDIDIVGDASLQAELELLAATGDALAGLGLDDAFVRINDRRILLALLDHTNVPSEQRDGALISIDKLDKLGRDGVAAELAERGIDGAALLATLDAIGRGELPGGFEASVLEPVRTLMAAHEGVRLEFDPTLVRGMGYYTGVIFEIAHPDLPYSIGGGGRYDGMIGRFLGQDVPAAGISLGFERLVDLVEARDEDERDVVALLLDRDVEPADALAIKRAFIARGAAVRMQRRTKNVKGALEQLAAGGATSFATVRAGDTADTIEVKPIA